MINENKLSILLTGPVDDLNAEKLAANCSHWRRIFPKNDIILSISTCSFNFNERDFLHDKIGNAVFCIKKKLYESYIF